MKNIFYKLNIKQDIVLILYRPFKIFKAESFGLGTCGGGFKVLLT